uniref:Uncharacterized protein n=1 Tax=Setaria viridis TaxID=4556 RepID=A0A4U6UGA8_SETVI|nr:hypothetical protein SEVIR_5G117900v2 [Setaria viridis]
MVREESLKHGLLVFFDKSLTLSILPPVHGRTPPHLLNKQNRKRPNMSDSTSIGQTNQFGLLATSVGDSSSLLQSQTACTGVAPQDGVRRTYSPDLLCGTTSKTSATSGSPYKEGTPRAANPNPAEHMRLLRGGSQFYHVVSLTNNGNNNDWSHSQHQQLAQYHCSQPGRNEQLSSPSYSSSQHTSNSNILHTSRTREASSLVLGKRPAVSNPASPLVLHKHPATTNPVRSFFQPPAPLLSNTNDMGPQCGLETDERLSLVQSMGTLEFLATSDKALSSGSSLHDPLHATSAQIPVRGIRAASTPNLLLGLGNGDDISKGKVPLYWDLDAMEEMMESMNKRQRKVPNQPVPDLTPGSDGQGGSKDKRN